MQLTRNNNSFSVNNKDEFHKVRIVDLPESLKRIFFYYVYI